MERGTLEMKEEEVEEEEEEWWEGVEQEGRIMVEDRLEGSSVT